MKTIKITVTDDVEITVETSGYTGKDCEKDEAVIAVKQALGQQTSQRATAEASKQSSKTQGRTH